MVGAIFHAPRSSVAVPIALPYAGTGELPQR